MNIEAITFDLWDTLVHNRNYEEFRIPELNRVLRSNGVILSEESLKEAYLSGFRYSTRVIPAEGYRHVETLEIVDKVLEAQEIMSAAIKQTPELVEDISLLSVFDGAPIAQGKKSVSLRVTYRSSQKTLEDDDVTPIHQSIADRLVKTFNASLPA